MDQKRKNVLMTGSTGAFGWFLAQEILKDEDVHLTLLVRASSDEEARDRVSKIVSVGGERVEVYKSDLTEKFLGLSEENYLDLSDKVDYLVHSAASTKFNLPLEQAKLSNITTTKNIIEFSKKCSNLIRFGYLSSALVAGKRVGVVKETDLSNEYGFSNTYQETKYEAELVVRENMKKVPTVIFRPPFIVSPPSLLNSKEQAGFLPILVSLVAKGYLPLVPGSEKVTMDLVNTNDATKAIAQLLFKEKLSYDTYHITNGDKSIDLKTFHKVIEEQLDKDIPVEYCGNIESFNKRLNEISKVNPEIMNIYKKLGSFLLEPAYPKTFDNHNTLEELGISKLGENPIDTLKLVVKSEPWNS